MTHINQRRDTAANWVSTNPVLKLGEVGWERDTRKSKQGNGTSAWNDLEYSTEPFEDAELTGTPTAPTAAPGTSTTQIANTLFVMTQFALKADLDSPTFSGTPLAPTAAPGTNTTQIATTAFVKAAGDLKANLASPTFTGTPSAPTAAPGTNTTQLATTAFVQGLLASPTFTGDPKAPTPATTDDDTSIATTAFVQALRLLGSTSVANVAALPALGTKGQRIYVEDIDAFAWWDDKTTAWQGFWKSYTPTIAGASSPTLACTYMIDEHEMVHVHIKITLTGALSGGLTASLPVAAHASYVSAASALAGNFVYRDTSAGGSARVVGWPIYAGSNLIAFTYNATSATNTTISTGTGSPLAAAWASGDTIDGDCSYRRA